MPYSVYSEIRDGKNTHTASDIFIQISIYTTYMNHNDVRLMTIFEAGYAYPHALCQYQLHMGQAHGNVQKCYRNEPFPIAFPMYQVFPPSHVSYTGM